MATLDTILKDEFFPLTPSWLHNDVSVFSSETDNKIIIVAPRRRSIPIVHGFGNFAKVEIF